MCCQQALLSCLVTAKSTMARSDVSTGRELDGMDDAERALAENNFASTVTAIQHQPD